MVQLRPGEDCERVNDGDLELPRRVSRHDASKLAKDKKKVSRLVIILQLCISIRAFAMCGRQRLSYDDNDVVPYSRNNYSVVQCTKGKRSTIGLSP